MWLRKTGDFVRWAVGADCALNTGTHSTFLPSFVGLRVARSIWAESQASAAKRMRTALFWDITQRVVVIPYRRLGTTNRPHLHKGPNGCPYTAVRNSHYSRRNTSE